MAVNDTRDIWAMYDWIRFRKLAMVSDYDIVEMAENLKEAKQCQEEY